MKKKNIQDAGFTLIELLVAFLLLGFLMSLLYGSFTFTNRVMVRTTANSERSFEVFQTQAFLTELLNNIYPEKNIFQGSERSMTFLAPLNREGEAEGLYKITLQQVRHGETSDLALSWKAVNQHNRDNQYSSGSLVLAESMTGMEFSYLDGKTQGSQAIWTSSWDQEGDLPTHVRLKLANSSDKTPHWPEQIIKIIITHNVDCMYDPVSRGCIYR